MKNHEDHEEQQRTMNKNQESSRAIKNNKKIKNHQGPIQNFQEPPRTIKNH